MDKLKRTCLYCDRDFIVKESIPVEDMYICSECKNRYKHKGFRSFNDLDGFRLAVLL